MNIQVKWSEWTPLSVRHPLFTPQTLRELLDGGQAFRWNQLEDGTWQGIWEENLFRLRLGDSGEIQYSYYGPQADAESTLQDYLQLEAEVELRIDSLPWRSDAHLQRAMSAFPGLRILKQPPGETLLSFLLSSNKQIPQIKQTLENLANRFGDEIAPGIHALPSWKKLAEASLEDLLACKLGYRAKYVQCTADVVSEYPFFFDNLTNLPYEAARQELMQLPGVGGKVADCVLLFGNARFEAFPQDVWILRTMKTRYHLEGWTDKQIRHFAQVHFGANAGLAQQYLFAWERANRHIA